MVAFPMRWLPRLFVRSLIDGSRRISLSSVSAGGLLWFPALVPLSLSGLPVGLILRIGLPPPRGLYRIFGILTERSWVFSHLTSSWRFGQRSIEVVWMSFGSLGVRGRGVSFSGIL